MVQVIDDNKSVADAMFAPRSHWSEMLESEHFVQFYEADGFLLSSLSGYIGAALKAGDAAIVVATGEHREGLESRLQENGLDVAGALASGQFISLDAAETLSKFMLDGSPDPARFTEVIGGIITKASSTPSGLRRVRIFGEMVALLWAEGHYAAAISLEKLWDELIHEAGSFSLFCAYPMNGFGGEQFAGQLKEVCSGHSRVIPAESYAELSNPDERLRAIIQLQQKARSLEAEIAERKEAEEQLQVSLLREQQTRVEAENVNRLKDEFLATVSHELRTPLNAILGWSQMLRGGWLDEATVGRAVETIERNAKAQAQIINDILDVSRIITGRLRLDLRATHSIPIIETAVDAVCPAAEAKGVKLQVLFDAAVAPVLCDADRLQQIVWNLLTNAIKFTPKGGQVQVQLEQDDSFLRIAVKDTGIGIDPAFLPYVFERFRQADSSSTRRYGGLGLGLAIVRHLVELQGGTVTAESRGEGQGAIFRVCLPLAAANEHTGLSGSVAGPDKNYQPKDEAHLEFDVDLTGLRILAVDDEDDARLLMDVVLGQYGAEVKTAASSAEALETLQEWRPDVIISDIAMPEDDGYAFIRMVRSLSADQGGNIPAIALTAYARAEDRMRALSSGYQSHLPKPIEPVEMALVVASLVGRTGGIERIRTQ